MTQQIVKQGANTRAHLISGQVPHFRYVDGFRGIAALYVVLHHALLITLQTNSQAHSGGAPPTLLTNFLRHGDTAVTFFIAISGFCLMLPLVNSKSAFSSKEAKRFLYRRARRILAPYYAALLLSMALTTVLASDVRRWSSSPLDPTTIAGIASHLILVHNLHQSTIYQINGPMWSIAVECQIYLLFPLLVILRRTFGLLAMVGVAYVVSLSVASVLAGTPYVGLRPMYLFVFTLGMSAAEFALAASRKLFIWVGAATAILTAAIFLFPKMQEFIAVDVVVGICSLCFLTIGAQWPDGLIARIFSWPPIAFVGIFSYSLYLTHSPLQQLIWRWFIVPANGSEQWSLYLGATVGTAIILVVSYWFYLGVERPFCGGSVS